MPQLHLNQGPQDALLYDNSRSYFTNVGYVRTSNFQMELRDVDPQNTATLGSTVQFVIPKSGDLLGPCDLMVDFNPCTGGTGANQWAAWVENVGYAMIDRITFSVGSNEIETITGDQLNIMNELMKNDEHRLHDTIGKTGRPSLYQNFNAAADTQREPSGAIVNSRIGRLIYHGTDVVPGKSLIIPTGLFFTKHPSQYFPLAAIAGCNDVRVAVKFRTLNELVQLGSEYGVTAGLITGAAGATSMPTWSSGVISKCALRCHYIHCTGPEATTLMNKEHVRLLKLWSVNTKPFTLTAGSTDKELDIDLSFLHPVSELIFTIRKVSDMNSSTDGAVAVAASDQAARNKAYFAYHGRSTIQRGGQTNVGDPNIDHINYKGSWTGKSTAAAASAAGAAANVCDEYVTFKSVELVLNGQERNPSLSKGITRDYMMNRLMPLLHSNVSTQTQHIGTSSILRDDLTGAAGGANAFEVQSDLMAMDQLLDRKEIYVYPFSLNPEGANPSGAVNFSKVSHAKMKVFVDVMGSLAGTSNTCEYQLDVYATYYNWLQIKDGRALLSFA